MRPMVRISTALTPQTYPQLQVGLTRLRVDRDCSRVAAVSKILEQKGGDVIRIDGDATVLEAVQAMVDANVGALLVTGEDINAVEGIFTERDHLRRVAVQGLTERETPVRDAMTAPVVAITPETKRRGGDGADDRPVDLPRPVVTDGGQLAGMVSIGDLVRLQSEEHQLPGPLPDRVHLGEVDR